MPLWLIRIECQAEYVMFAADGLHEPFAVRRSDQEIVIESGRICEGKTSKKTEQNISYNQG